LGQSFRINPGRSPVCRSVVKNQEFRIGFHRKPRISGLFYLRKSFPSAVKFYGLPGQTDADDPRSWRTIPSMPALSNQPEFSSRAKYPFLEARRAVNAIPCVFHLHSEEGKTKEASGFPPALRNGSTPAIQVFVMNNLFISRTCTKAFQPSNFGKLALYGVASLFLLAGALPSCATSAGFGRDVEKVGDEIQEAAR